MYIKLTEKQRKDIITDLKNGFMMPFHLKENDGTIVNYCFKNGNDTMVYYDYDVRSPLDNGRYCMSEELFDVPMSIEEVIKFFNELEGFYLRWSNVDCDY